MAASLTSLSVIPQKCSEFNHIVRVITQLPPALQRGSSRKKSGNERKPLRSILSLSKDVCNYTYFYKFCLLKANGPLSFFDFYETIEEARLSASAGGENGKLAVLVKHIDLAEAGA